MTEPWATTIRFTDEQRDDLLGLGVYEQQIDALEHFLGDFRDATRRRPTRTDVRNKLQELDSALENADRALNRFLAIDTNAATEARLRVRLVDMHPLGAPSMTGEFAMKITLQRVEMARRIIAVAATGVRGQQRHSPAQSLPIHLIDYALREGYRLHHAPDSDPGNLPTSQFNLSRTGNFPSIVETVCRAIGYSSHGNNGAQDTIDVDRAIRHYLRVRKLSDSKANSSPDSRS